MNPWDPNKLSVEYRNGVTDTEPTIGRKYTLTHSDISAELYLTIGTEFAMDKVTALRDEVLAEWRTDRDLTFLFGYVYVNGNSDPKEAAIRNAIFRRELPLALKAIRYGDRRFFEAHMEFDWAPIWIHFDSTVEEYNQFEFWGFLRDYIDL